MTSMQARSLAHAAFSSPVAGAAFLVKSRVVGGRSVACHVSIPLAVAALST